MEAKFLKTAVRREEYPDSPLPRIAFSGRSNVGKSSLINSLVNRKKLAKTSSTPGRTRTINFFNIADRWIFVDLPGYGFAKVSKSERASWGKMIETYFQEDRLLKLAILIVDIRHDPSPLDIMMRDYFLRFGIPFQVVATKADKLSSNRRHKAISRIQELLNLESLLPYSSATGMGQKELWQIIREV